LRYSDKEGDDIVKQTMALVVWSPTGSVLNGDGDGSDIGPGAGDHLSRRASDRSKMMMKGIEMLPDRSRDESVAETMSSDASQDETSESESTSEDEDEDADEESEEGYADEAHLSHKAATDTIRPGMNVLTLFPFFTWTPADAEGAY